MTLSYRKVTEGYIHYYCIECGSYDIEWERSVAISTIIKDGDASLFFRPDPEIWSACYSCGEGITFKELKEVLSIKKVMTINSIHKFILESKMLPIEKIIENKWSKVRIVYIDSKKKTSDKRTKP